jgi:hypothetical protein
MNAVRVLELVHVLVIESFESEYECEYGISRAKPLVSFNIPIGNASDEHPAL